MSVLITGAGGFIGRSLASALLGRGDLEVLTLTDLTAPPTPEPRSLTPTTFEKTKTPRTKVNVIAADLTSHESVERLLNQVSASSTTLSVVYILHGLMSGDSEQNHPLSQKVNIEATTNLLGLLTRRFPGVRVVFSSSCAVYGPQDQDKQGNKTAPLTELTKPIPTGTYGAHKAMMELYIDDLSRRREIDAVICRLPTIVVRAGKPTGAASSFASGMFREPLQGLRSTLPVRRSLEIWICSARTIVRNLMLAGQIDSSLFKDESRVVLLPGQIVTVDDMLAALREVGGPKTLDLIEEKPDEKIIKIVEGWATRIDDSRARSFGFGKDGTLVQAVREFVEDYLD